MEKMSTGADEGPSGGTTGAVPGAGERNSEPATRGSAPGPSGNAMEQFLLLSKSTKGLAAVELVKQVLEHQHIYVFGELLDQPSIKDLQTNLEVEPWHRLLKLFALGVYKDYLEAEADLPKLTPAMLSKLRYLTIVTLAAKTKRIPYSLLLTELGMKNLRELEDLIIELIYLNIIEGKMDQMNGWIEVDSTVARDIKPEDLDVITNVLANWCDNCDNVLVNIEQQILLANMLKTDHVKSKQDLEHQINKVKSNIKASGQEMDEDPVNSGTPPSQKEVSHIDRIKRSVGRSGMKSGLRGSGSSTSSTSSGSGAKFWK